MRIRKIQVVCDLDESPFIFAEAYGTYASEPGPDDRTIDREARGNMGRSECRYFVAVLSEEETGHPGSVEQDYQRMEALNRGEWCFECIEAKAVIEIDLPDNINSPYFLRISSLGVSGIESDCDSDDKWELIQDELAYLKNVLEAMNVDMGNFDVLTQAALNSM